MSKVVLYYFPVKALGEASRLLLAYGGEDFEDIRIPKNIWPEHKPLMPFGQLPVIEVDGQKYGQSISIARYLGRKYGLVGSTLEEDLQIDQNVQFLDDLRLEVAKVHYEQDEEIKSKQYENSKDLFASLLNKLDDFISKNNGHIAAGKLTWGDFVFAGIFDYLKMMLRMPALEETYPSFKQVIAAVYANPKVKEFTENAPRSDY